MKKLLLILLLSLSFSSYGEWTQVAENDDGDYFLIDFGTVKVVDGNVYWWDMIDAVESYWYVSEDELYFSEQSYYQGDCQVNRFKILTTYFYSRPLGEDLVETWNDSAPQWDYYAPDTIGEYTFELVCRLAEELEASPNKYEQIIKDFKASVEYTSIINRKSKVAKVEDEELLIIDDPRTILQNAWLENISARVRSSWRYEGHEEDWKAEVYVVQDRDGKVLAVDVKTNIKDRVKARPFRNSIERAVYKASPLPAAPDDSVFDEEIYFIFMAN